MSVGNSRVQIGLIRDNECHDPSSLGVGETGAIVERLAALVDASDGAPNIVMSSVNPHASDKIEDAASGALGREILRLGRDIPIRIHHTLTDSGEATVGQDRLVAALGAFALVRSACVVVDLGTAITIDFVDGTGVFHGGAILPGVAMMLASLHDGTAALPELAFERLDPASLEPGKQTDAAMRLGVSAAVRGAIRVLTERYAEYYGAYPSIISTGGDLGILEDDALVDTRVPDLILRGIYAACARAIGDGHDDDEA